MKYIIIMIVAIFMAFFCAKIEMITHTYNIEENKNINTESHPDPMDIMMMKISRGEN